MEGTNTKDTKSWALIRPSLGSIEGFMCSRVRGGTKLKNDETDMTGDNGNIYGLPSDSSAWTVQLETLVQGGIPRDLRGEVKQTLLSQWLFVNFVFDKECTICHDLATIGVASLCRCEGTPD